MDVEQIPSTGDIVDELAETTAENAALAVTAADAALAAATASYDSAELSAKVDLIIENLAGLNAGLSLTRGLVEQVLANSERQSEPEIVINVDSDDADSTDDVDSEPDEEIETETEFDSSEIDTDETIVEQPELAPIEKPRSRRGLRKNRRR